MSSPTRTGTVALIVRFEKGEPSLVDSLSDDTEIAVLESAISRGDQEPLAVIQEARERIAMEEEAFGDYVEELLCQSAVRPEVVEHGVQWLKSKLRIEEFQKTEREATRVIAEYAYKIFKENPTRQDFLLAAPTAKVRIRVFSIDDKKSQSSNESEAA